MFLKCNKTGFFLFSSSFFLFSSSGEDDRAQCWCLGSSEAFDLVSEMEVDRWSESTSTQRVLFVYIDVCIAILVLLFT